ncbi:putative SGNH hydrolase-type esterase domain-containing protein [Rosa chinensis]|uniref:Putative SGNH hydrolase-type esterase domain-containing protein n=1 Tax=Rosa chinensis TaxID=74649 RepID=A0A2P6PL62_ROSCH|nr:putative SGNH hydrolase-type esterase domain-containing protein [Rosa chinensis]
MLETINYINSTKTAQVNYWLYGETYFGYPTRRYTDERICTVIDIQTQLSYFKNVEKQLRHKLGYAQAKTLLSSALYIFSIGSNDYFAPLRFNISKEFSYSQEEFTGMVIGNLTHVVKVCCGSKWSIESRLTVEGRGQRKSMNYIFYNPIDYVFFDGSHPTERTNQQFSKLMWSENSNVTWPCNVQELFGTLWAKYVCSTPSS